MDLEKMKEVEKLFTEVTELNSDKVMLTRLGEVLGSGEVYGGFELSTPGKPIYTEDDMKYAFLDYYFELTEWNLPFLEDLIEEEVDRLSQEIDTIERELYLMGVDI